MRLVRVKAEILPTGNMLVVCPEGANHLPDKWATFMRNVSAIDEKGQTVRLRHSGDGAWHIPEPLPKKLILNYEVEIKHDQSKWPFGSKEAAYARDDGVFLTGAALFITMLDLQNMNVRFDLPQDWKVSVAWEELTNEKNAFKANNAEELLWIGMLAGKHLERSTKVGQLEVVLAVGQDIRQSAEMLDRAVKAVLPRYVKIYGGEPVVQGSPLNKFVIIVNVDKDYVGGGAVFVRTISMMLTDVPQKTSEASTFSWQHIITHELGHLWDGQSFSGESEEVWFQEGVTDYLAYLVQSDAGLIGKDELLKVFARKLDEYVPVAGKMSLTKAGSDKGGNYDLLYSGGLIAALALDVEIRKGTQNKKGIADVLKVMYQNFAAKGQKFAVADVRKIAGEVAGKDLSTFFADHIDGNKIIPLAQYADAMGLSFSKAENKTVLKRKAKASSFQKATFSSVTGLAF